MASIIKKKIRGQTYYYAVESKRVDGKPRIVWQKYLGKVTDIVKAVGGTENCPVPQSVKIYSFGAEAALLVTARRLGLGENIDKNLGWDGEGLSTGNYLLLYAIKLCVAPEEKLSKWFERTMLRRCFDTGSRMLSEKRLTVIGDSLTHEVIQTIQGIQLSTEMKRVAFIFMGAAFLLLFYFMPQLAPAVDPAGKVFELPKEGQAAIFVPVGRCLVGF